MSKKRKIAGLSLNGGRRENFFFCLLEYFEKEDRWFLSSLHQVKDESEFDQNKIIQKWVEDFDLEELVVDFPMTSPPCFECPLDCPGENRCPRPEVVALRKEIDELMKKDQAYYDKNPKAYERARIESGKIDYPKNVLKKETTDHLLSKSFKRKLKKGFTPYWNRPIDFYIWKNYYDQLLDLFNVSFDSYGSVSTILQFKLKYLSRHLPNSLKIYEGNTLICLLELLKAKIISHKMLIDLGDMELVAHTKFNIIKKIEEKCKIFLYQNDIEKIVSNPRGFESFLLAIIGKQFVQNRVDKIPSLYLSDNANFLIPTFS